MSRPSMLSPHFWLMWFAAATSAVGLGLFAGEFDGVATARAIPTLVRQPYLQRMSATSATVVWATLEPGLGKVRYRRSAGGSPTVVAAQTTLYTAARTGLPTDYYQHEATLNGLNGATTYQYDVLLDGVDATSVIDELTTAPPAGTGTVSFAVFGDSGSGSAEQRQLAEQIAQRFRDGQWDLAIHTGDIVYPDGTYKWLHRRFFDVYAEWLRRWPIFFGVGNHEYNSQNARPYLDLFALPENGADPFFPDHRERFYSFDFGPIHFVSLDTQSLAGRTNKQQQLTWLVRDLEATTQPWRIVFMHIPSYGSSDFSSTLAFRAMLEPIFARYGVQIVLAGHEHDYARGAPWREQQSPYLPVMHVVTGGGGAGLNTPTPGPWLVKWARAFHFLSVVVTDCTPAGTCQLTLDAIGLDGQRFDTFTLPLRAQQLDASAPAVAWVQPAPGAVVSNTATIRAAAKDDQGVVKVDLWIDGALRSVDDTPPYEWSWNTTNELNGNRLLELRAVDLAGRVTSSEARMVRVANTKATVRVLSPLPGERVFTTMPYRIRWAGARGAAPLSGFRVEVAADGKTFQPVAGCGALQPTVQECLWNAAGPVSTTSIVKVTALDSVGGDVFDTAGKITVASGTPSVKISFPDQATVLGAGSTQGLGWTSGTNPALWQVEMSRDGGASWDVLSTAVLPLGNEIRWLVTGPPTPQGLVRVKSIASALEDVSNAPFQIAAPFIDVTGLTAATVWKANSLKTVKFTTNLGKYDRLNIRLSVDGGSSFPHVLAGSVHATAKSVTVRVPMVTSTAARVMVESLLNPDWRAISPANFKIVPP